MTKCVASFCLCLVLGGCDVSDPGELERDRGALGANDVGAIEQACAKEVKKYCSSYHCRNEQAALDLCGEAVDFYVTGSNDLFKNNDQLELLERFSGVFTSDEHYGSVYGFEADGAYPVAWYRNSHGYRAVVYVALMADYLDEPRDFGGGLLYMEQLGDRNQNLMGLVEQWDQYIINEQMRHEMVQAHTRAFSKPSQDAWNATMTSLVALQQMALDPVTKWLKMTPRDALQQFVDSTHEAKRNAGDDFDHRRYFLAHADRWLTRFSQHPKIPILDQGKDYNDEPVPEVLVGSGDALGMAATRLVKQAFRRSSHHAYIVPRWASELGDARRAELIEELESASELWRELKSLLDVKGIEEDLDEAARLDNRLHSNFLSKNWKLFAEAAVVDEFDQVLLAFETSALYLRAGVLPGAETVEELIAALDVVLADAARGRVLLNLTYEHAFESLLWAHLLPGTYRVDEWEEQVPVIAALYDEAFASNQAWRIPFLDEATALWFLFVVGYDVVHDATWVDREASQLYLSEESLAQLIEIFEQLGDGKLVGVLSHFRYQDTNFTELGNRLQSLRNMFPQRVHASVFGWVFDEDGALSGDATARLAAITIEMNKFVFGSLDD